MNKPNEMTHRIAVFQDDKFDFVTVFPNYGDEATYAPDGYVRISEWQTIDFKALPPADLAEAQMQSLATLREKTVTEFRAKLEYIDAKIENLRALTGPESQS
jgi:hypothetical protein